MRKKPILKSGKKPNTKMGRNEWLLLAFMLIVLIGCVIYFAINIESNWQAIKNIFTNPRPLPPLSEFLPLLNVLIPPIFLCVLLWIFPGFRKWICDTIGEGKIIGHHWYRFILPSLLAIPFVSYVLLSGIKNAVPPVMEFSLIAVAPTLGGLILATANRRTQKKGVYNQLVSVAQKLIVATILLIIFTSLFFASDIFGNINMYSMEWSWEGFIRWAFFWGSTWAFYIGTFLFLLGISDLVIALRHLRK